MARHSHPLSGADNAWLRMESRENPMTITGVLMLGAPMDRAALRALLEERLLIFERFTHRLEGIGSSGARWVPNPGFDIEKQITTVSLPAPHGQEELEFLVSDAMSEQLSLEGAPWHIHHVENYQDGTALIVRLHHVLGDGIALVHVLLSLADEDFDPDRATGHHHLEVDESERGFFEKTMDSALKSGGGLLRNVAKVAGVAVGEGVDIVKDPRHLAERARQSLSIGAATTRVALLPADSPTLFKGQPQGRKRAAWSRPLPLEMVKAIGRGVDAKLNDVLMSAVAGGLRRYLKARNQPLDGVEICALIPVNLRSLDDAFRLGNEFGLVFLRMPVGVADPIERLAEVKRRMDRTKFSSEPLVIYGLLHIAGSSPKIVQDGLVALLSQKASTVITNVPGPPEKLHLHGRPVDEIMFWVPQGGTISMGVSILSYAGNVLIGFAVDEAIITDPDRLVEAMHEEFEALSKRFAESVQG